MDCREARRLLDEGVRPGSHNATRANLGFHLAGCATCRAYRDRPDDALLLSLLEDDLGAPPAPPAPAAPARRRAPAWLRYSALAALLVIVIGGAYLVGSTALALLTIQRNVQAMQLPTDRPGTAAPSATPRLSVPTPAAGAAPGGAGASSPTAGAGGAASSSPAPSSLVVPSPTPPRPSATASAIATALPSASAAAERPAATFIPVDADLLRTMVAQGTPPPTLAPINLGAAPLPTLMPTMDLPPPGQAINVLLLGIDRRPDETGPARSDTIIVAHIQPGQQRIALLSLPRDLIVAIPGYGQARINAASVYGEIYPQLGGGIPLMRKTVSNLLGLKIDYVVSLDFLGFIGAIDAIGGVTIDVPEELYDPAYPTMDYGYMEAYFAPGVQHMDGETALIYARIRHTDSNYARNRRQQQVMLAVVEKLRQQNAVQQLQSTAALTSALRDYVSTDMPLERMVSLAWAFRGIDPDSIERYALDETMVAEYMLPDDPYATFAQPGAIDALVDQLVHGP